MHTQLGNDWSVTSNEFWGFWVLLSMYFLNFIFKFPVGNLLLIVTKALSGMRSTITVSFTLFFFLILNNLHAVLFLSI